MVSRTPSDDVDLPVQPRYGVETGFDALAFARPRVAADHISLELDRELPDVCAAHGHPTSNRRPEVTLFYTTNRGREQATPSVMLRAVIRRTVPFMSNDHLSASLHADWPVCDSCDRRARILRRIALALIAPGPIAIFVAFAMLQSGADRIHPLFAAAIFPLWCPLILIGAAVMYTHSRSVVRFRPIVDKEVVTIRAHPNFAAAIDSGD